jgi:uncharacterized protein (DUF1684 family)
LTGPSAPALLELMDWKRRVGALYAAVRAGGAGAEVAARFRAGRDALFAGHPQSPLPPDARAGFAGARWFPYRDDLRVEAALEPEPDGPALELPVSTGAPARFRRIGRVAVDLAGAPARLPVFWLEGYGGGLFLPFRDALAGRETYGGGRYLLDTVKGADLGMSADGARLVLDFNYAYNPSCAYDPRWSCPLAPIESRLTVAVEGGEGAPG